MSDNPIGVGGPAVTDRPAEMEELASVEDPRVVAALEDYAAQLRAGKRPERQALLNRFPQLAGPLAECLDGLDFVWAAGSELGRAGAAGPAGRPLGDFRILREVGCGGMGVVFEAEQLSLGRRVALKVLPFAATLDPRHLQRFVNEARAAASLEHPHIVPVYGVGCERGVHFYAMKFIEGQSLAQRIADLRQPSGERTPVAPPDLPSTVDLLPGQAGEPATVFRGPAATPPSRRPCDLAFFRQAAEWGIQAAAALEHAHTLGIVHRDVKPANLLIDRGHHLWVTDFGLARVASERSLTLSGDLVGTLRYMSPEQALAKHGLVDHHTDIYALGATLYELLTLEPAVDGKDHEEILHRIESEDTMAPRKRNRAIPTDLETIVLKAMAREPKQRYDTAQALADDLRRWLAGEPIVARPPSRMEKVTRWAQRNKRLVYGSILFLLLAVLGLLASTFLIWCEKEETHQALRLADARTRWARKAVNDMYTEVAEKWLKQKPELTEVECRFLRNALDFYEELAQEKATTPEDRLELALAHRRIGVTAKLLWDQQEKEEPALSRAVDILDGLARDFPGVAAYRLELARSQLELGSYLWKCARFQESEQWLLNSIGHSEHLVRETPEDAGCWHLLAAGTNELGELWRINHRFPEAEKNLLWAAGTFRWLLNRLPGDPSLRGRLGIVYLSLVDLFMESGRLQEAETACRQAIHLYEEIPADSPFAREAMKNLGGAYNGLAVILLETNQLDQAEKASLRSLELRRREIVDFPNNPSLHHGLALSCSNRGRLLLRLNRPGEAVQAWEEAFSHQERVVKRYSYSQTCRQELAIMYGNLAGLYTCGSNQVRSPEKALALIQKARELVPEKKGWLSVLQGVAWYRLGKWQEARNWLSALIPGDGSPPPAPGDWTTDVPFLKRAALEGDRQSYSLALFFLAMSEWQLGDRDRARQLYHQGGRAAIESKGGHMAIEDIRTEAARLLGILEQLPAPQEVPPEAGSARDRNFEKKGNF